MKMQMNPPTWFDVLRENARQMMLRDPSLLCPPAFVADLYAKPLDPEVEQPGNVLESNQDGE